MVLMLVMFLRSSYLALEAAGVQKEARSSEAAQRRGRTATFFWRNVSVTILADMQMQRHKKEVIIAMITILKKKGPFYQAEIFFRGQVQQQYPQRSPLFHHSHGLPCKIVIIL